MCSDGPICPAARVSWSQLSSARYSRASPKTAPGGASFVTARWHEELRERITAEQRSAVLRIKDDWHRRPAYPHQVGGLEIYTAVMDGGIRTPDQFATWLAQHGLP